MRLMRTLSGATTESTKSHITSALLSNKSGASNTKCVCLRFRYPFTSSSVRRNTQGCTMLFKSPVFSREENARFASSRRLIPPSGVRMSSPNAPHSCITQEEPGATASRERASASIIVHPFSCITCETVLFPAPVGPVRPTITKSRKLLHLKSGGAYQAVIHRHSNPVRVGTARIYERHPVVVNLPKRCEQYSRLAKGVLFRA